jgi:serine/threonine protein kinase
MNNGKVTRKIAPQRRFRDRLIATCLVTSDRLEELEAAAQYDDNELARALVREGLLTSFQVKQVQAGATGFFVGKYVVLDLIGRGGNGIVFKARHCQPPHQLFALKTIDTRSLHLTDEALGRFQREIELVVSLHHPNVVRAYETIQARSHTYLVMEHVEGEDLNAMVKRRGALPVQEAVDYVVQAARGIAYAHRCGIVHRDLKPANLMVTTEGVVKITDLGLARDIADDTELTLKGRCLGTPEFMAPEQAEDASSVDGRCDLFSLGATLFHLLTGELHVEGSSYMQRLQNLLTRPARPLAVVRPDVHPQLAAVIDRLRARNSADRPASAEEALRLLEPFTHGAVPLPQQLSGDQKFQLVLRVLEGNLTVEAVCLQHGVDEKAVEGWRQTFLEGALAALGSV